MRGGHPLVVPVVGVGDRLARPPLGEDRKPHLAPPAGGVDAGPVGLELDVPRGLAEGAGRLGVVPPPGPHQAAVSVAGLADGVVADVQAGQLAEQPRGPLERPLGPGDAEQPLGVGGEQAADAQAVVQRVGVEATTSAGEVSPPERHVAGGGDDPTLGLAVAPPRRAAGQYRPRPPFSPGRPPGRSVRPGADPV